MHTFLPKEFVDNSTGSVCLMEYSCSNHGGYMTEGNRNGGFLASVFQEGRNLMNKEQPKSLISESASGDPTFGQ